MTTVPWWLVGSIVAAHMVLTAFFYLIVGSRRNTAAVMGGADADNTKADTKVDNGSPLCSVLSYNVIAVGYSLYCAYAGTTAWFDGSAAAVGATLNDRFYAYSAPYAKIATATIGYELYNTAAVIFLPEYYNAAFLGHHSTCFVLGIMSTYPFCHYYATFFFGLTCISSVPLALVELFQAAQLPTAVELSRALFAISFLTFRTVYWYATARSARTPADCILRPSSSALVGMARAPMRTEHARTRVTELNAARPHCAQAHRVVQVLGGRSRRAQRRRAGAQRSGSLLSAALQYRPDRLAILLDDAHLQGHCGQVGPCKV